MSNSFLLTFNYPKLKDLTYGEGKNVTSDNKRFVRKVWEVDSAKIGKENKWLLYAKGGSFRKWFGNMEHVVDWSVDAREYYRSYKIARIIPSELWYREGITWTDITSSGTGFRYLPPGTTFDATGLTIFFKDNSLITSILALLNSSFIKKLLPILNPTLHAQLIDIKAIPVLLGKRLDNNKIENLIRMAQKDWNCHELSRDFDRLQIIYSDFHQSSLNNTYNGLRKHWQTIILEMQKLEEANNCIIIKKYGLQQELSPKVPLSEITLNCNPHYRYKNNENTKELESLLLSDTIKELISYSVGCMFGRYSLDKPGLILANKGETVETYLGKIPKPLFEPDDDNVIPIMDIDWFPDDIVERFKRFLKVTFGEEHYTENLEFIEKAIGKDIRKFFLKDFYTYHIKMYKKRPIYWMFSSPKGNFNALIYMHRYKVSG